MARNDLASKFAIVDIRSLWPHEEVDPERVEAVTAAYRRLRVIEDPLIVDEGSFVILDGHHRYNALLRLGARRVPTHLVDYKDPRIVVEAWRQNESPPSKDEVVARARSGRPFPPKTTRHAALYGLGVVPVPLADLL